MKPTTAPPSRFRLPDDRDELARLKRLTGLDYEQVPESLLQPARFRQDSDETVPAPAALSAPR